ncbi:MAG: DUF2065 domain-containing protein [Proteobacteria bacterium]|nr:DUF2065 domain-containing protein [Pseudomonadota bacterium]MDB4826258.1 DUF2065 domain-containing protein [Gammaproteobacteria bacterium]MBT4357064.1 DUF2065 domain-containing protein [Pseudomonadota bacterium]MBT4988109.1 DUF2065 domain-containing protein [Pseudomonadota bacterium]MBT5190338.1 DUF2065 domain-containing protein [Pseudomonadota bacterium]
MDWQSFLAALALVFVIEGLIPFASPRGYRSLANRLQGLTDRQLRVGGAVVIVLGLIMLAWIKG